MNKFYKLDECKYSFEGISSKDFNHGLKALVGKANAVRDGLATFARF